ncbi:MAG: methylmalonyl-CoA epimerase [Dehalococcoidia bacterium]|nr:methylmalonyl-CoA epimerase [Dehalococcoidia bacterium]
MGLKRIDHVVVAVKDCKAAGERYAQLLGKSASPVQELPALGIKNTTVHLGDAFIELAEPLTNQGPVAKFLEVKGEGLYLLSVEVDDMDATIKDLTAKGVQMAGTTVDSGSSKLAFVHPKSTHGVLLQLVQKRR